MGEEYSKGFKGRNQTLDSLNDIWVRKTLIHPWVLLIVGLGWYLDVFKSESHVLVWVFEDFFEKNRKKKENGNLGKMGPFAVAKGTLAAAKSFAASKGCLIAAKSKDQKGLPSGSPRHSPTTPRRSASP